MTGKRIGLAATVLLGVVVLAISAAANWASCSWYGYQTERQTRFAPYVGCLVKTGNAWVPRSELRTQQ